MAPFCRVARKMLDHDATSSASLLTKSVNILQSRVPSIVSINHLYAYVKIVHTDTTQLNRENEVVD